MINELARHGNTELLTILIAALNDDGYYLDGRCEKVHGIIIDNIGSVEIYNRDDEEYEAVKDIYDTVTMFFTLDGEGYLGMIFVDEEYILGALHDYNWLLPDLQTLGEYSEEKIRYRAKYEENENHTQVTVYVYDRREDKNYEVVVAEYIDVFHAIICAVDNVVKQIEVNKKYPIMMEGEYDNV